MWCEYALFGERVCSWPLVCREPVRQKKKLEAPSRGGIADLGEVHASKTWEVAFGNEARQVPCSPHPCPGLALEPVVVFPHALTGSATQERTVGGAGC